VAIDERGGDDLLGLRDIGFQRLVERVEGRAQGLRQVERLVGGQTRTELLGVFGNRRQRVRGQSRIDLGGEQRVVDVAAQAVVHHVGGHVIAQAGRCRFGGPDEVGVDTRPEEGQSDLDGDDHEDRHPDQGELALDAIA
jgi:hypothetical protein